MESLDRWPQGDGYELERDNCIQFFMVDFIGWNNRKWDMHEHYHSSDVYVEMMGVATTGVENHIADMQNVIKEYPDMLIQQHTPPVAEGNGPRQLSTRSASAPIPRLRPLSTAAARVRWSRSTGSVAAVVVASAGGGAGGCAG